MISVHLKWLAVLLAGATVFYMATNIEPNTEPNTAPKILPTANQAIADWRNSIFWDQQGRQRVFNQLLTKPTVLSFTFTGCGVYCPAQTASLSLLQKQLNKEYGHGAYQIISVSLTPWFDKPETMDKFAERFSADYRNWHFLIGSEEATRRLIEEAGVSIIDHSKSGVADIDHTTDVYILNTDGTIASRILGIPLDERSITKNLHEKIIQQKNKQYNAL
ncbi:MAG: SCO family protein [Pseudomonadota bacterium]